MTVNATAEILLVVTEDHACAVFVTQRVGAMRPRVDGTRLADALASRGFRLAGVSWSTCAPPAVPAEARAVVLRSGADVAAAALAALDDPNRAARGLGTRSAALP